MQPKWSGSFLVNTPAARKRPEAQFTRLDGEVVRDADGFVVAAWGTDPDVPGFRKPWRVEHLLKVQER